MTTAIVYSRQNDAGSRMLFLSLRKYIDCFLLESKVLYRGAGSEVWNQVYMIAPVKKFGRVRLSSIFLQNKYGGECRHGRAMSFCSVLSFSAPKHQEKVFINLCNGIFGHQEA